MPAEERDAFAMPVPVLEGQKSDGGKSEPVGDLLGIGMNGPWFDHCQLQPVCDALEAAFHQSLADPHAPRVGMNRKTTEFPDEIGIRPDVGDHRRRPQNTAGRWILGDQQDGVVGEHHLFEHLCVVILGVRIILAVGGLEDVPDRLHIRFGCFANAGHGKGPSAASCRPAARASAW